MPDFRIKIAESVIEIHSIYDYVFDLCRDYLTDESPDYSVSVTEKDIEKERISSNNYNRYKKLPLDILPPEKLESYFFYHTIDDYLVRENKHIFHAATIDKGGNAYMFLAPSRTGKTTHILNWMKVFDDVVPINGDMPILMIKGQDIYACGTPWCGVEGIGSNRIVKLKAIFLLNRGEENRAEKADKNDVFDFMINRAYYGKNNRLEIIRNIKTIVDNTDLYSLYCNMSEESALVAYKATLNNTD